ncbi:condensation domain-containing protein [Mycobacterium szulgai]|uniref:condensation domain-containing protein n=1 Tax=Mycobacterium szulgai TaxID=1787 RepID=UPI003FD7D6CF
MAHWHNTTVSTVLQAAWACLLSWLTGQEDVVFGVIVSGRRPNWRACNQWWACSSTPCRYAPPSPRPPPPNNYWTNYGTPRTRPWHTSTCHSPRFIA